MMLQILKSAQEIERGHTLSLAQVKSDGGIRKAQKRGPHLYNFLVRVHPLSDKSEAYYNIENEIMNDFDYGASTVQTQMPTVEVSNRGNWTGTILVKGASQKGTTLLLDGFTVNDTNAVKKNDWIQLTGANKVFQAKQDASADASGNVTILLNSPIVGTIANNAIVIHGNAVKFNLALVNPGSVDASKEPATASYSIAQFGAFDLQEVI